MLTKLAEDRERIPEGERTLNKSYVTGNNHMESGNLHATWYNHYSLTPAIFYLYYLNNKREC